MHKNYVPTHRATKTLSVGPGGMKRDFWVKYIYLILFLYSFFKKNILTIQTNF